MDRPANWGARIKVWPTERLYVSTGVYHNNPDGGERSKAWDFSLDHKGNFIPLELGWVTGEKDGLDGLYAVGAYHNTAQTPDVRTDVYGSSAGLTGDPFLLHNGRAEGYVMAHQRLTREIPGSERGLTVGGIAGIGDHATARFRKFFIVGFVYQGIGKRNGDFVSFIASGARTNPRLTRYQRDRNLFAPGSTIVQTSENILELDYGVRLAPWLLLRSNLQYIMHPGGNNDSPDVLVVGLSTSTSF
ncbi:carbohydrate porin [Stenotrophomonas sp.]|uniref:carbohydrate porin n=1 Tax=Stenotrophomonas sp. TaxID=69392 RepID=UPI0028AD0F14|nr:carbohydrate porin [Stenotrophomonas sp.]